MVQLINEFTESVEKAKLFEGNSLMQLFLTAFHHRIIKLKLCVEECSAPVNINRFNKIEGFVKECIETVAQDPLFPENSLMTEFVNALDDQITQSGCCKNKNNGFEGMVSFIKAFMDIIALKNPQIAQNPSITNVLNQLDDLFTRLTLAKKLDFSSP